VENEDLLFGLTTGEVVAIAAVVALFLTVVQMYLTSATERSRTQPIVINHERRPQTYNLQRQRWVALARVAHETGGAAFNVRFGVSYYGVRFAYRLHEGDPLSGNRHRVLKPDESFTAVIEITSEDMWAGAKRRDESVFYWARYQNASGATWETRNPPDRTADLDIKRVRWVRWREWRERRKRMALTKESEQVAKQIAAEVAAAREAADEEESGSSADRPGTPRTDV
jgi:hypothetical protein